MSWLIIIFFCFPCQFPMDLLDIWKYRTIECHDYPKRAEQLFIAIQDA
jgi:hypothetical protein